MNTEMDSAELQVVYEATSVNATVPDTTINVTVGEGAKIEVGEAITYIKSGQAEIGEAVAAGKIVLDNHTTAKIGEFNSNATEKTNAFNSNATDKTTAFNNNATSKTNDFNDNYTEKKAIIDEQVDLAKDWATKTDGKVDGEDYSAKYYAQSILPIASDITTVAGIASDVTTVSSISSDVTSVAGNATDISTVADSISDVNSVATDILKVTAVADDLTNIDAVNANKTNIDAVAGNNSNITAVANNATNINAVAGNESNINAVNANKTNIDTVAGISTDVTTVSGISSDVTSVASNNTDISAVADDLTNINSVADDITNIDSVAGDLANIDAVAGDLTNINNASTYADNANIWAEGSDAQVQALGGVHSSKGWAEVSSQGQVQSNWAETDTTAKSYIQNKPTLGTMAAESASDYTKTSGLATVATSGNYNDLSNKPTIPTVTSTYSATGTDAVNGTAVASAISGKANDSDVVKLTGDQSINGKKTFTANTGTTTIIQRKTENSWNDLQFHYNDTRLGAIRNIRENGLNKMLMYVANSSGIKSQIGIRYDDVNSIVTTECPRPTEDTTNSNQIDTVGARNTKLANYQPLLTSGTNIKTINGNSVLGSGDINIVADTDLSNLTSQGQNIANWSSNVSNCITEIPQDIKLELNNGTLTLKAGSKVYVPNGAGVFDVVNIESDLSTTRSENIQEVYFVSNNGTVLNQWNNIYSGTSAPSGQTYMIWYDTANNIVKATGDGGSTWTGGFSFPIALATSDASSIISIDQVFNGFGYIGSTVFALPNVRGLIPNGRNADGSLNNIEITTSSVLTETQTWNYDWVVCTLYKSNDTIFIAAYGDKDLTFDENKNLFFFNGGVVTVCPFTKYRMQNGISNFTPKTAFHALDYNDSSIISGWAMPSSRYIDLTLGASGATYTAPANGFITISKSTNNTNQYLLIHGKLWTQGSANPPGYAIELFCLVTKGEPFVIAYNAGGATNYFKFYYAEGENV